MYYVFQNITWCFANTYNFYIFVYNDIKNFLPGVHISVFMATIRSLEQKEHLGIRNTVQLWQCVPPMCQALELIPILVK